MNQVKYRRANLDNDFGIDLQPRQESPQEAPAVNDQTAPRPNHALFRAVTWIIAIMIGFICLLGAKSDIGMIADLIFTFFLAFGLDSLSRANNN